MDFSLTEEQQEVQNLARQILEDLVTNERLKEVEAGDEIFDRKVWSELAKAHLLGVGIDEASGGSGMGYFALCILLHEIGRSVAPVPVLPTLVLGALPLEHFGNEVQKRRWLPGVARGEVILTAALEEEANNDTTRPTTRAVRDEGGWRLDGRKICVPAARGAERILVAASTAEGRVAVFLVDPSAAGVSLEAQHVTNRQPHFQLTLDGVAVAAEEALGDPERGAEIVEWLTQRAVTAYCAVQAGVSERALRMTAEYTSGRMQFDRPVGSFQAVHMRAGDAFIDVGAMQLTWWDAAWRLEAGQPADDEVAIAKYWAAEAGQRVGYAAQHLHGGIGIDVDYPLHRYYLWAKQIELTLGSAPVQLERIGARLAREPVAQAG